MSLITLVSFPDNLSMLGLIWVWDRDYNFAYSTVFPSASAIVVYK